MKRLIILVFALGVVGVIANPVSKQTLLSENKNSLQSESSESHTKHEDDINTVNKGEQALTKDTLLIENLQAPGESSKNDAKLEIIIEAHGIDPTGAGSKPLTENCVENSDKSTEKSDISKDVNEKVEIIIEENVEEPIDDSFTLQGGFADVPMLSDSPRLPEYPLPGDIGDSLSQLPGVIDGLQFTGDFVDTQIPGFMPESPQLPSFIGSVPLLPASIDGSPQLPGLIEGIPQLPEFFENDPESTESEEANFVIDKDYFKDDMQKVEHEIMETAAGFIPSPIAFRRKQKPRRRFAIRRHFRRNPYRRHQMVHVYPYSYYAFYRPSSLRYY